MLWKNESSSPVVAVSYTRIGSSLPDRRSSGGNGIRVGPKLLDDIQGLAVLLLLILFFHFLLFSFFVTAFVSRDRMWKMAGNVTLQVSL